MNNLLLFMSISGTVAFGMYFLCRNFLKEKLAPGYRYILLKLIMLFYLFPFPLLSSNIRKAIGRLYGNEALINGYAFGKNYRHLSRGKFFYMIDKQTMIPDYRGIFWICVIVWGGMCALYLGNFVYHKIKLKKIRQYAVGECGTVIPYLNKEYEMIMHKHRVRIVFMPMHTEAFTYGFFSSVIAVPVDLDSESISYVLKHELTHIRRRDIWINFFAYLAVAIHFYNPFIYLFYKEIMKTAELSCDEQTLKNADREERVRYGHMLIEQACRRSNKHFIMGFSKKQNKEIKERVSMIKTKPVRKWYLAASLAVMIFLSGTVPVLGYVMPEAIEADTYEKQEVEYIEIGEIDTDSLEDEKMFQSMDSYFITEGNKIITEVSGDSIQRRACRHKYEAATQKIHTKFQAGGCRVDIYSVKRCTKCGAIKDRVKSNSITYEKCIHKG